MMTVYLNDKKLEVDRDQKLASLLEEKKLNTSGIAVAINSTIVPRQKWTETQLNQDDKLTIITATAGG